MEQTFIIVNDQVRANAITAVALLPLDKWEVSIKRKGKTPAQRRYWHKCMDMMCEGTGYSLLELKTIIKRQVLGVKSFTTRRGELIEYDYSSEDLTVVEYTKLIEHTLTLADMAKIALPNPRDYGFQV
ncbi:hypothetical protein J0X19_11660 [Hymenobacter sp. BT186]|uniref:NinB protein n=1 Tax=Hymenobacter telluris TaxID=2816474 RepID=A0A939EVI4_9BACT|nr:hypothetical protein [Hymenobacter telluris]MBO0358604.1 hypothetical protein [Hymenobacter telluris]MBW3374630.1 hypothetical protein [Hymenobacter norwichensis]